MFRASANLYSFLPELCLALALIVQILALFFRKNITPKTFYTIAKFALLASSLTAFLFYNQDFGNSFTNNEYTTLFKLIMYLWAWACFYLSLKWFLSQDKISFRFYALALLIIIAFSFALSVNNLWLLWALLETAFLLLVLLLKTNADEEGNLTAMTFFYSSLPFSLCAAWGIFYLSQLAGGADYSLVAAALKKSSMNFYLFMACVALLVNMLFKIGLAPFHFLMPKIMSASSLPVSCFVFFIPVFAYYAILIKMAVKVFAPVFVHFQEPLLIFAVLSMIIGVAGANSETNLRRIFAYVALFNLGIVFSELAFFDVRRLYGSFIYLISYMLALSGVYTLFYALKSKGDYLNNLKDISGISLAKPLIAAAMLLCLISMLGLPPMMGFFGLFSLLNGLAALREYWLVAVILAGKLFMAYAYLKVIKVVYFDAKSVTLDRVDKGIYLCLFVNIILTTAAAFNPRFFLAILRNFLN